MSRNGKKLKPAERMVEKHLPFQVQYHKNLAMLGKTNPITDPVEVNLLGIEDDIHPCTFRRMRHKVLLYDVSQSFDMNESRANLFLNGLRDYIGLSTPVDRPKIRQKSRDAGLAIDICDDKLINLRMELVKNGMATAEWIKTYYFMVHPPDVTVSSPEYFRNVLSTWSVDPGKHLF
jgi:hypothetical protein